jgi:CubicO group peptidase (beta-lactamase class C family)
VTSPAADRMSRRLRTAQREQRLPAVSAQVLRAGTPLWGDAVHAGADDAFRIGSITKTFTAVLVLQCRDDGLLALDDPIAAHLPIDLASGVTIRRCLSHLAGVQREPDGDVWAGGPMPDADGLLAALGEQVGAPGRRFHYSNLAFALLGQVAAARRGTSWEVALGAHLLAPLGLTRTTVAPSAPAVTGGFTAPWSDQVHPEPEFPTDGVGPATQLWSTAPDLARWGAFLADPPAAVLAADTLAEMTEVAVMADTLRWSLGYGLGLMLYRRGERILVGHGGAMPGFLAGLAVDRESRTVAAVLTAAGRAADAEGLACGLVEDALEADPPPLEPWNPGGAPPHEVAALLGHWWTEGSEVVFSWHERLEARLVAAPAWRPPAVFERLPSEPERWRTVSGRETGELLRVERDASGEIRALTWATYALTRAPLSFGELFAAAAEDGRTGP